MRGLRLATLFVMLSLVLSGCSLFVAEESQGDQVCIPKAKLDSIGLTVDQLLEQLDNMTEDVNATPVEDLGENDSEEETGEEQTEETEDEQETEENVPVRTFSAGELVQIQPQSTSDDLTFTYSEPLDDNGEWQTTEDDVGEYVVDVTATNAAGSSVTKQVRIVIESANQAPEISGLEDVTVNAGENVELNPQVTDPDGDEVTVSYSGWMTTATKETTEDDVGEHTVTVTAGDGTTQTSETVTVTVNEVNNPPSIADLSQLTVTEGELVSVDASATDPDGDNLELSYSEPLDEDGTWQTQDGDAGTYSVTVTASDGELEATETFSIIVEQANNAPEIEQEQLVEVFVTEGESTTVELEPVVTDPDGDEVEVTYSGFMDSATKTVTADDEGEHSVTITASDGEAETSVDIVVTVTVNTPPEFTL